MSASEGGIVQEPVDEASIMPRAASLSASPWEQRILQLDGRRYSLRLEHEFWTALEQVAERRRLRLNRLVAEVAAGCSADSNLSSALRVHCLNELQRAAAGRGAGVDRTSLIAMAETAPTPCLLLDADQTIIAASDAMLRWSGIARETLVQAKASDHFRVETDGGAGTPWARLACEGASSERAAIVGVAPDRAVAADAMLVPIVSGRGRRFCLVWVRA
jgi:predicted DNA-binding ribbon-helix-helix protein